MHDTIFKYKNTFRFSFTYTHTHMQQDTLIHANVHFLSCIKKIQRRRIVTYK